MKAMTVLLDESIKVKCCCAVCVARKSITGGAELAPETLAIAGNALLDEFKTLAPFSVGEVRITKGYQAPTKSLIHTLAPEGETFDETVQDALRKYYTSVLDLAAEKGVTSIAIPTICVGKDETSLICSIETAVRSVEKWLVQHKSKMSVLFCAKNRQEYQAYELFYPMCAWRDEEEYENTIMDVIDKLANDRRLYTREKALAAAKQMREQARKSGKDKVIQVYGRLCHEFETATDEMYELLYQQCHKKAAHRATAKDTSLEAAAIRCAFFYKRKYLTEEMIEDHFCVSREEAKEAIKRLIGMNYIRIADYRDDETRYGILISKKDFYLIHGK